MNEKNILNEVNTMRRQMGLPVLNEAELLELELSKINLDPLNEGWWENAKYALSKLGRYKVGGNILGKKQMDDKYKAQIADILEKKSNEVIRALDQSIRKNNLEFPNNKSQLDFVNTIIEIATVYDSLVAATKLKPDAPGFLPIDAANAIIEDLRIYTQKYLDADLTAAFSVFNENEEIVDENDLYEAEEDLDVAKAQAANKFAKTKSDIKKGDLQSYNTERMKTLKSWKLPLALMGAGASFGALSWLIEYIFPPEKITTMTPEEIKETVRQTFGNIKPGEGMTQIMNRTLGMNLSPSSNPNDVVAALSKLGGGNAQTGVEIITQKGGIFADPAAAKSTLTELVKNPTGHGTTLKQVFAGTWAGTGKMAGDTLVTISGGSLVGLVTKAIVTWTAKTTVIKSAKAIIAAPILKTIGIGLFAGGVAAALARWKGRKSSRAQLLNDLVQYIRPIGGTKENPPIVDDNNGGDKNPQGGDNNGNGDNNNNNKNQSGNKDGQLYRDLKKYFQDIFNFKAQVNTDTYGQGGSSNPTKQYSGGGKVDKKVTQPNDVNDIYKLMEGDVELINLLEGLNRLVEADDSLMRSINAKGQAANQKNTNDKGINDVGLSSNQVKLFKNNINRLTKIIRVINSFGTQDKNLNNLLSQAKSNPLSTMDLNSLLVSDDKSLKIFISDFNKAVYSVQFKNGNNIMDQLKLIGINKLNEAAERVPGKGEMNKVYNDRREFLKNLPNYLKSMYAVFSFLIDRVKKGELSLSGGNPNIKDGTNKGGSNNGQGGNNSSNQGGSNNGQGGNNSSNQGNSNNNQSGSDNEQGDQNANDDQSQESGKPTKRGGNFYGSEFYEGVELQDLMETHNNLIDIILENVVSLDEFGDNQPEMKQGREDAIMNSSAGLIFQELSTIIPDLSAKITASYEKKHGKKLNRIKLANFLSVVLGSLAKVPTEKMVSIISRADMDVTAYKRMLKDVMSAEDDAMADAAKQSADDTQTKTGMEYNPGNPEKFLPEKVGNYDLSGINQAARIALVQKAAQIISRNTDLEQSTENVLEVMKQLIDDINKLGNKDKQIPLAKS